MTDSTTTTRVSYTGDGSSTNFTITFPFYLATDILVQLAGATVTSGYSVSGGNGSTGTLTMATAPVAGVNVQAILNPPLTQSVNLVDGTAFPSATLNQVNDRAVQIGLRLQDQINRTTRAPDGDAAPVMLLPTAANRVNKALMFDSNGNIAMGVPNTQVITTDLLAPFLNLSRTAAESAAGVMPTNLSYSASPYIDVRRYGADPTGAADSTSAIQAAINVAQATSGGGATGATVLLSPGTYKVTSQLLISGNRIRFVGAGRYACYILFAPTANGICLKLANGATTINQCYLADFTIWSNDAAFTKTALDITDESGCTYERLVVGGGIVSGGASYWSGGTGSIGIRVRGRDTSGFRDITAFCDKPLVISTNPHSASISIDHHNFHNCFLGGNGFPIVTIEPGVVLTQVSFTGFQAWVVGTGGLYWVDATAPGPSNGLVIENLRYENATDATQYTVHIDVGSNLNSLKIGAGQSAGCRGFYLRNVGRATFENFYYVDPAREAMNADSTVQQMKFINCFWQTGSTATLTGLYVSFQRVTGTSGPLPSDGYIVPPTPSDFDTMNSTIGGIVYSINNNGALVIGAGSQLGYVVIVAETEQVTGLYELRGTNHLTSEVNDVGGFFTNVQNTPSSYNIYWDPTQLSGAGGYVIQNTRGGIRGVRVMRLGRA